MQKRSVSERLEHQFFEYLIARLEVFKETKNYVLLRFYQISVKRQRLWVTYFFHYSLFKYAKVDTGTVVQWVSLLGNFIQQKLNSGSAQVRHLPAACRRFAMVRISDKNLERKKSQTPFVDQPFHKINSSSSSSSSSSLPSSS